MKKEEPQLLSVRKAASFLGVSANTIRQWAHTGKLKGVKLGSRGDWRFTKEELSEMIQLERRAPDKVKKDLTDRKEAEEVLYRFAALVESSEDAIVSKNLNGIITSWNRGAEKIFGWPAKDAMGKSIMIIIPKHLREEERRILSKIRRGIRIEHFETIRVRRDGRKINVSLSISPIKDSGGEIIGGIGINRDITERKQIEENLKFLSEASRILSSSLNYQTTFNSVARIAVPHIADWCTVHILEGEALLRVALAHKDPKKIKWAKEMNKQYPTDMNSPTGIPHVLKTGKSEFYPRITDEMLVATARDEKQLTLLRSMGFTSAMIIPIFVEKKCIGAITFVNTETCRNFTHADLTMAEQLASRAGLAIENARLYTESQKAVAVRDEFISVASHELKTPVTSLKIYTQVLQKQFEKKGETNGLVHYFQKMDAQIDKLTTLISDLLNVSRMDGGRLEFREEKFDLGELVHETVENIAQTTKKHKILITGGIPKKVWGDRDRVGQVITNLLTNAIKYSPRAKRVIVHLSSERDMAKVSVQDFGIGIEKAHQNKIFSRFYRVSSPDEKTYPGLGLGLYISHEIIRRHGGRMSVISIKGEGSEFSFTIPYGKLLHSKHVRPPVLSSTGSLSSLERGVKVMQEKK